MIIHGIHSENFLKYSNLDLNNLPEKGLIAVCGQNESGKTSIGETLCFALFGRTFTLELDDPRKLIRWGESQCSVSVEFSGKDGVAYEVKRYLDDEGVYGARLVRIEDGALMAKGVDRVGDVLRSLIGFGYDEFIESFYLAQRELSTPHPHSQTIKVMAGIAPLAAVAEDLQTSIDNEKVRQARTAKDYDEAILALNQLGIDEGKYPRLQQAHKTLSSASRQKQGLIDDLALAADDYRANVPKVRQTRRAQRLAWGLGIFFFLLAALSWAAWGLLNFMPDSGVAVQIQALAEANIPNWATRYHAWVLPLAILLSGLTLFEVFQVVRLKGRLKTLTALAGRLAERLDVIRLDSQKAPETLPKDIAALVGGQETGGADQAEDFLDKIKVLESRAALLSATNDEVAEAEDLVRERYGAQVEQLGRQIEMLDAEIAEERQRLDEAAQLGSVRDSLNIKMADHMHRIKVREVANSLLDSASHHLSHRFNQSILKLAGAALPKFTQGRYQHLKIDENLDVRVFSSEKHDFMGFEEISSGTQRQIMLALRLAMSQELIRAIESGPQFIFFDEPFAFFDQQRIRETLNALPEFSDEIRQIWLVAQEFPENINVDLFIPCSTEQTQLSVG